MRRCIETVQRDAGARENEFGERAIANSPVQLHRHLLPGPYHGLNSHTDRSSGGEHHYAPAGTVRFYNGAKPANHALTKSLPRFKTGRLQRSRDPLRHPFVEQLLQIAVIFHIALPLAQNAIRVVFVEFWHRRGLREARQLRRASMAPQRSGVNLIEADVARLPELAQCNRLLFTNRRQPIRILVENCRLCVPDQHQRAHFAGADARALPSTRSSSSLAMDSRCTSSGPSARRSVREFAHAPARKVSWLTPAAP